MRTGKVLKDKFGERVVEFGACTREERRYGGKVCKVVRSRLSGEIWWLTGGI